MTDDAQSFWYTKCQPMWLLYKKENEYELLAAYAN